ncbi:hypothetical protein FOA43_000029 [Brettanomyces nanus]|uniref:N-acetyltransferase domain-containing protein n=1 Tax=Eeniella nana TaxID=13502 RepID=A0A875RWB7_EENNA|nr:uncharacterized protein FOA43_000029 [Brettanomyces nanus]QPG72728.1 hypothetical protein FOA43_000029 [Brettanomyces nanus]
MQSENARSVYMERGSEIAQAKILEDEIKAHFPLSITCKNESRCIITPYVLGVESVSQHQLLQCLEILTSNLGETYKKLHGRLWKVDKIREMNESGLVYALLKKDSTLIGFMSMKLVVDDNLSVIYLYEIQIANYYRGMGLGSQLMEAFSSLPDSINANTEYLDKFGPIDGTSLTVFSTNERAIQFYRRHGYRNSRHSPTDKITTNVITTQYATHIFMPSIGTTVGMKTVTGSSKGFNGLTTILDKEDGHPIGILNAATLTAFRTALCTSLVLTETFPLNDPESSIGGNLICYGVGAQAEWHIRLALLLYGDRFKQVVIVNRTVSKAHKLTGMIHKEFPQIIVTTCALNDTDDLLTFYEDASVIFSCVPTTSPTVLNCEIDANNRDKIFIGAIGSFKPQMIEIEGELIKQKCLAKGGKVIVDSVSDCLAEAGEFIQNDIGEESLIELASLFVEPSSKNAKKQIEYLKKGKVVISKLVGLAIMDVSIGNAILSLAKERNIGTAVEF